mgnify:CR=1 FL=1
MSNGHIELIIGPMFSGKTSHLIARAKRYTFQKKRIIVIKYISDTRYSDGNNISTHDNINYDAIVSNKNLGETLTEDILNNIDVILIDEGQFYDDLYNFCIEWVSNGKIIIIAGLNGTYLQKPFGQIIDLIPQADIITKLSAVCAFCTADAHFTTRIDNTDDTIEVIGSNDIYQPVCRACLKC